MDERIRALHQSAVALRVMLRSFLRAQMIEPPVEMPDNNINQPDQFASIQASAKSLLEFTTELLRIERAHNQGM